MGMEFFYEMLNRDAGAAILTQEDRLAARQVANEIDPASKEQVLLVRLGGDIHVVDAEAAAMAAGADPDFVVAIPFSQLRLLVNRSVN